MMTMAKKFVVELWANKLAFYGCATSLLSLGVLFWNDKTWLGFAIWLPAQIAAAICTVFLWRRSRQWKRDLAQDKANFQHWEMEAFRLMDQIGSALAVRDYYKTDKLFEQWREVVNRMRVENELINRRWAPRLGKTK